MVLKENLSAILTKIEMSISSKHEVILWFYSLDAGKKQQGLLTGGCCRVKVCWDTKGCLTGAQDLCTGPARLLATMRTGTVQLLHALRIDNRSADCKCCSAN